MEIYYQKIRLVSKLCCYLKKDVTILAVEYASFSSS
jgi:hypothetical protein